MPIMMVANGDHRESANRVCWQAQALFEEKLTNAVARHGREVVRAHHYDRARSADARGSGSLRIGRILRQQAALALDVMVQQHERDMSAWQAEWEFIPETSVMVDGALCQTGRIYGGLEVHTERMAANLRLSDGLINAEAVMMALAPHIGRNRAHSVVSAAARRTVRETSFLVALLASNEVAAHLDGGTLEALLEPDGYLGEAPAAVDAVLADLAQMRIPPDGLSTRRHGRREVSGEEPPCSSLRAERA